MSKDEKIIKIQLLEKKVFELEAKVQLLEEKNAELTRRLFGTKSERREGGLNEAEETFDNSVQIEEQGPGGILEVQQETADQELSDQPDQEVDKNKRKKNGGRRKFSDKLMRCIEVKDLENKSCECGHEFKFIGDQISEKLAVIPAKFYVAQTILKKYCCPSCENITTPQTASSILPKTNATPSLLALIVVAKYGNALPLYRQEQIFSRIEVSLSRQTMARWIIMVSNQLHPIITLLKEIAFSKNYLQMDETIVQVLDEPERPATSKSYMWVMSSPVDEIYLYHYAPTRSGDIPNMLLEGYQGLLQVDGYDGYNQAVVAHGLTRLGCWMHARRKFYEATQIKQSQKIGEYGIKLIKKLYKIEEKIKDDTVENRLTIRQKESFPIALSLKTWCEVESSRVTPTSYGGKAISYLLNEWKYLERCFEYGNVSLDNGSIERHIRPFAIGRNNWLFADTVSGAQASATLYSLQVTAVANDYNPEKYFEKLFTNLPLAQTEQEFLELLPLKKNTSNDLSPSLN